MEAVSRFPQSMPTVASQSPKREEPKDAMPPRYSDENASIIEAIHTLTLEVKANSMAAQQIAQQQAGKKQPVNWMATIIASIALLSSGISWLGSSGMAVGSAQQTIQRLDRDVQAERDARMQLQNRFDRLRDLYMVEFGADPEDPNTKVIRKRK